MRGKGEATTMSTDWMPGAAVGLGGSFIAWLLSWRLNSARIEGKSEAAFAAQEKTDAAREMRGEDLRRDLQELKEDWRAGIAQVNRLAENIASLQSAQNAVNGYTAKAIETLTDKLDRHESQLADHGSTLRLLTNAITSRQVDGK